MDQDNRSFLRRFGDVLLDGVEASTALELHRRFNPEPPVVFTPSPVGAAPVGAPTPRTPAAANSADLLILGIAGFAAWQLLK